MCLKIPQARFQKKLPLCCFYKVQKCNEKQFFEFFIINLLLLAAEYKPLVIIRTGDRIPSCVFLLSPGFSLFPILGCYSALGFPLFPSLATIQPLVFHFFPPLAVIPPWACIRQVRVEEFSTQFWESGCFATHLNKLKKKLALAPVLASYAQIYVL